MSQHRSDRDVRREFVERVTEIVAARRFAEQVVGDAHGRVDDVLVVVSELASNAVRHARSPFSVRVCEDDDHVRIEVADRGAGWPIVPRGNEAISSGGMGLNLVEALADRWGAMERPGGKVVWAELDERRPRQPA